MMKFIVSFAAAVRSACPICYADLPESNPDEDFLSPLRLPAQGSSPNLVSLSLSSLLLFMWSLLSVTLDPTPVVVASSASHLQDKSSTQPSTLNEVYFSLLFSFFTL